MDTTLADQIRSCPSLPSLPAIAVQLLELTRRDDVDVPKIAKLVQNDPALSAKLLKTVNSSFYARASKIATVQQAVMVLGLQSVRTLVLSFSLVDSVKTGQGKGFKHESFWRRSVHAAAAARVVAQRVHLVQQEEVFFAALLSDIGMLAFDQIMGEGYGQLVNDCMTHTELAGKERTAFTADHAEVSAMLAESWNLPPVLSEPVRFHQQPEQCTDESMQRLVQVVALAGLCADIYCDRAPSEALHAVKTKAAEWFELDEAAAEQMIKDVSAATNEVASLLELKVGKAISYDAILRKANDTLVELTLRSQQQVDQLAVRAAELEHAARIDGLTGLCNRAEFDRQLAKLLPECLAIRKPMSLLMLDADKFKTVNDTHGHDAGDAVLKFLAEKVRSSVPADGFCARFGGEEMVIILPETDRASAVRHAEALRLRIEAGTVEHERLTLKVTVSIGVACADVNSPLQKPALVLKAADMALYAAKQGGRNRVKVISLPAKAAA